MPIKIWLNVNVTRHMWELVETVNEAQNIEQIMESEIYEWWRDNSREIISVTTGNRVEMFQDDISGLFQSFQQTLERSGHGRLAEFNAAYRRICDWCQVTDLADSFSQQTNIDQD